MNKLESTEDAVGDVSDDVITKSVPDATRAVSFERGGLDSQLVKPNEN